MEWVFVTHRAATREKPPPDRTPESPLPTRSHAVTPDPLSGGVIRSERTRTYTVTLRV